MCIDGKGYRMLEGYSLVMAIFWVGLPIVVAVSGLIRSAGIYGAAGRRMTRVRVGCYLLLGFAFVTFIGPNVVSYLLAEDPDHRKTQYVMGFFSATAALLNVMAFRMILIAALDSASNNPVEDEFDQPNLDRTEADY